MELTKEILIEIIEDFANRGIIFSNEAQFQFELARKLQEKFPNCNVELEVLSLKSDNQKISETTKFEKMYTDIILTIDEKRYAVELKFKTAYPTKSGHKNIIYKGKNGIKDHIAFGQGAPDCGSYDFLKDVERLERLVLDRKDHMPNDSAEKGFAIIITNDYLYWYGKNRNLDESPYKDFYMIENDEYNTKTGTLGEIGSEQRGKERADEVTLQGEYKVNWKLYDITNHYIIPEAPKQRTDDTKTYEYKYMIFEVKK